MSNASKDRSESGGNLLVTGGSGLLGSAVQRVCPDARFVSSHDCDLTDSRQTFALFERARPARVIHLAGLVGGVKFNAAHNADMLGVNLRINANVLTAAQHFGVERLVAVLSSCAFRIPPDRPATEDELHEGLPYEGNLGYGVSKRILDLHCKLLWQQHGCRFSTITPVTMYGPQDNFNLDDGHAVASLIHRCVLAKRRGAPLVVWGTGLAVRQFVFASDVARVLLRELDLFDGPETTIVAPDAGLTVADLVTQIARVLEFAGPVDFSGDLEGQRVKVLASHRFDTRHPGFEFTPLAQGLAQTVRWFVESLESPESGRRWASASAV